MIQIRKAKDEDFNQIWEIFHNVIITGDTYVFKPDMDKETAYKNWMAPYMETYVAEDNGNILGTYILKANQQDLGAHVANASYMVHPEAHGKGIGYQMGKHSLLEAKKIGYKAMQFNMVIATNKNAIALWEKLGFKIVGTVPKVFNHKKLGYVDAHIMYKWLDDK